jgi:hypothetical protein
MTIYEIKKLTSETSPYFFSRGALKHAGQTMKSFSVYKLEDGRFRIAALTRYSDGTIYGTTERFFNPANNKLERK